MDIGNDCRIKFATLSLLGKFKEIHTLEKLAVGENSKKCGNKKSGGADDDGDDEGGEVGYYSDQQFLDAVELAIRSGKVSTSLLQRKLSIGYGKAAKFIDAMEDIGIVSEQNGQKPRDVLISLDEWHEKLSRVNFED
jgi:DNA segregation ATPase FtsK/SpoIIIE-like protein